MRSYLTLLIANITNRKKLQLIHAREGDTRVAFSRVGVFHARSRFARSTIPEGKWGTTRSLQFWQMESSTHRNDQTGQSGPPSKLVLNIPVGPNRNGPFHFMYQPRFPEFGLNGKCSKIFNQLISFLENDTLF